MHANCFQFYAPKTSLGNKAKLRSQFAVKKIYHTVYAQTDSRGAATLTQLKKT